MTLEMFRGVLVRYEEDKLVVELIDSVFFRAPVHYVLDR